MKYRQLADTGVFVSELCLGTMTFGGRGQMWETIGGLDQPAVDGLVHRALDAGVNFFDTADVYASGESETMLGKALAGRRHDSSWRRKCADGRGRGRTRSGCRASTSWKRSRTASCGSAPITWTCTRFIVPIR